MPLRCPDCGASLPEGVPAWTRQLTVADAMTRALVTLGPEDTLMRALEVMRLHGIRRIPLVVADTLVGLLTEGDLKRAQPSTLSDSEEQFNRVMEDTPISRIMIANPVTVEAGVPLLEAARTLLTMKFGALPVMQQGKLVGIITYSDLLRALVELLSQGG